MKKSVIGIIFSEDRSKVLMIKRRDVPMWTLPGGGIEKGETAEEAITREMHEETGYHVAIKRKVGDYYPVNFLTNDTTIFECAILRGAATTGDETRAIGFFSLDQLPKATPPPYPDWIQDALLDPESAPLNKGITSVTYSILFKAFLLYPILVSRYLLTKLGIHLNSSIEKKDE